jgi:hypothetical protein
MAASFGKAVLRAYDPQTHRAVLQPSGSPRGYLERIAVAANIPPEKMEPGSRVAVLYFDRHNPAEALVIAVY